MELKNLEASYIKLCTELGDLKYKKQQAERSLATVQSRMTAIISELDAINAAALVKSAKVQETPAG